MPIVPKVDVHGACATKQQKHQVHTQAHRDNERTNEGVVGNRSRSRPAHVENSQFKVVDFYHFRQRRRHRVNQQRGDDTQTYETDTYQQAALQRFRKRNLDADAQNREDDWHHHGSAQSNNVTKNCFH